VRAYCLQNGVLVGVGGVYGNVVRIQPPLVITREQLDRALEVVEEALGQVAGSKSVDLQPVTTTSAR
ncbi:MAG: hypothetical protein M3328_13075, partial [Chloroflexota bacterium]|nr:hypothetical protein [Chloroflexota bacterium]